MSVTGKGPVLRRLQANRPGAIAGGKISGTLTGVVSPIRVRMALRQLVYRRYRDAAVNGEAAKADAVIRQGRNLRKPALPQWWLDLLDRDGLR